MRRRSAAAAWRSLPKPHMYCNTNSLICNLGDGPKGFDSTLLQAQMLTSVLLAQAPCRLPTTCCLRASYNSMQQPDAMSISQLTARRSTSAQRPERERQHARPVQREQPAHGPREGRLAGPAHAAPERQAAHQRAQLLRQHLRRDRILRRSYRFSPCHSSCYCF